MSLIEYQKPYLTVAEQVELLRARGMGISNSERAQACLRRIGYYRLSGYAYPFRYREIIRNSNGSEDERVFENFRPQTEFSTVMDLYVFDKKLRLLFLDAIERIEVGLRVEIALLLGKYGRTAYRDASSFNSFFRTLDPITTQTPHEKLLSKLDDALARSREEFAQHYKQKYSSELPIWMSIELWDFGTLATILNGMRDRDVDELSVVYGLPRRRYLTSWCQSINFVRNVCAHHGRLWNRPIVQQPAPPKIGEIDLLEHLIGDELAQRRLYAVAAVLQYLMRVIHPSSTWATRLASHLETLPESIHISARHAGFPNNWRSLPLWSEKV